jgi:enoyl-CoA hydratase
MSYETILVRVEDDGVAWLTFNRPEKRNALDQAMVDEVHAALRALQARDDVSVLILRGAGGKAFVGGADIGQLRDRGRLDALRRINSDLFRAVERFSAPTIAAIEGFALGGGCEVALACDLRLCGESAKLGQPEVGLGIIPGAGATYRLPRLVGLGRAKELIFSGRIVTAGEALNMGLVEQVVPDAEVEEAARRLAQSIAKNSALAVRLAKASLNAQADGGTDAWQALESAAQAVLFEDAEKKARMTAFLEKKAARKKAKAAGGAAGGEAGPTLVVRGQVEAEVSLGYEQLLGFPADAQVVDVGALVPGKQGQAVRLGALVARAKPKAGAGHVQVSTADGVFSASEALGVMERALIVYGKDGRPLPADQGGPFRLLIPDAADKCANVKGVAVIEVRAEAGVSACSHTEEQHAKMRAEGC